MREVEGEISRLGGRGHGIMDAGGERYYVPFTVPGDRVVARVGLKQGDGYAAEARTILKASADRAEPPCAHFHVCGGCTLQHVDDRAYAAWKRDQVVQALARQGFDEPVVADLVRVPPRTRRRADFVARKAGGKVLLGFHEAESRRIVDIAECWVLDPRLMQVLPALRLLLAELLQPGESVDVKATLTDSGIDLAFVGAFRLDIAARGRLVEFATAEDLAQLATGTGAEAEVLLQRRAPVMRFGGVPVPVPPGGFLQAVPQAEAALTTEVLAGLTGAKRVIDLFSGAGTFSLPLSAAHRVHAVDGDRAATAALLHAVNNHNLAGRVTVETRDLVRRPLQADEYKRFDAALFDPPRVGAREQAAELAKTKLATIVGVSCNPSSFARDARLLAAGGFRLVRVVPVDQFLWSAHVELVGHFTR